MKGYKAFEKGMICKGKQYSENTIFEENEAIENKDEVLKDFAKKIKDHINDLAVEAYGDMACDTSYLMLDIDELSDYIDELLKEYTK